MRPQPLLVCRDVEASSRFYQRLLGCVSAHGGAEYERLVDPRRRASAAGTDGLILQLHAFDADHHHGPIADRTTALGNGVLLWFEVDDFGAAAARARELRAPLIRDVHRNPPQGDGGPAHRELWLRDPDGYAVVLASPDGEAAGG